MNDIKDGESHENIAIALGNIMFLYSRSTLHSSWSVDLAINYVLPAIAHGQFIVVKDRTGGPLAYVSWAWLNLESEARYLDDPNSLMQEDWNNGDRLWFIDMVSPVDGSAFKELYNYLTRVAFPKHVARSLRLKHGDLSARIKSYSGVNVSKESRKVILAKYYFDLKNFLGPTNKKIIF